MKKMRILKAVSILLTVGGIAFLSFSCVRGTSATATPKPQIVTVQKGNISITVTGTGNLAYSHSEDLAFEMPGYAEEVSVSAGDTVTKDQGLARVDTTDWEKQVRAEERAVAAAQRTLSNKQDALSAAQRQVVSKELDVNQKQLDVQIAQYALTQVDDVKTAQDKVDSAQQSRDLVLAQLQVAQAAGKDTDALDQQLVHFSTLLDEAQKDLDRVLKGQNVNVSSSVALQIAQLQLTINQKQQSLSDAQNSVETARTAVKNAQLDVTDAEQDVRDAQSDLEETQSLNAVIKAPFDGFITKVNVNGGDEIKKGTVAMQIADPNQFEANILVTERDISSVRIGADATVSCDAYSGLNFPAKITEIAPLATVQQGVVNYKVTVQLTSTKPTFAGRTSSAPRPAQSSGAGPAATGTAQTPPAAVFSPQSPQAGFAAQAVTLKDGLSVTVTIPIQEKDNVLVIPSRAITRQGATTTVQVMKGTATETRTIKSGLTDGSNSEVTDGLSEGEQVLVKAATTSSTGPNFGPPPGGGFMIR